MERIENKYDGYFYGYCNGDLLFHSSLLSVLKVIHQRIQNGELDDRVSRLINIIIIYIITRHLLLVVEQTSLNRSPP